jgi:hypothetical protein
MLQRVRIISICWGATPSTSVEAESHSNLAIRSIVLRTSEC